MKRKDFHKTVRVTGWTMVAVSALLPFLIIATVATFVNGLWQFGIFVAILLFADFMAIPLGWPLLFGPLFSARQVYTMINEEGLVNITQIAKATGVNYTTDTILFRLFNRTEESRLKVARSEVITKIRYLISHGYLYGWTFDDNYEYLVRPEKEEIKVHGKCPNCGAKLTPDMKRCEYCGFIVKR